MTKNTKKAKQLVEKLSAADLASGVALAQKLSSEKKRKFVESLDLAVMLGIDAKQTSQSVKGSVTLPHGLGKKVRVIVVTSDAEQAKAAEAAGAVRVGGEELITAIDGGFLDFDCCIATQEIMPKMAKAAKKLGPRGLMPSQKNGTVTNNVKAAVADAIKGKVNFKNDKDGIVHFSAGKVDFKSDNLLENINFVLSSIKEVKPESLKGKYITDLYLNTTMGPSIRISNV